MTPTASLALAYVRVSTHEQAQRGLSLDAQRAALQRLAAERGLTLEAVYEDTLSGTTLDRPGLQALLSRIAGNKRRRVGDRVTAVLITKLDRLSRNTSDGIALAVTFQRAGIVLVTLEDGDLDRSNPMKKLMHTVRLAFASFESDQTSARTRFALQRKKERGERAGTIPYGYHLDPTDATGQRLEPDDLEQSTLRTARSLYLSGLSYPKVAERLNASGLRTRRGSLWRVEYVRSLLLNHKPHQPAQKPREGAHAPTEGQGAGQP